MSLFRNLTSLTQLKLRENENVSDYLKNFDEKINNLRSCGFDKTIDSDHLFKTFLLASLPSSYESLVGGIVTDLDLETYEEVYNKILNKSVFSNPRPSYPVTNLTTVEKKLCHLCNRFHFGHCATECPRCKKPHYGHNKCVSPVPVLNKNPSNYSWYIDSGANISVSNSVDNFQSLSASTGDIGVACIDGRLSINGIGEIYLIMPTGKSIHLCNVIYSSNAARNILSVHDLTKVGFNVLFTDSGFF